MLEEKLLEKIKKLLALSEGTSNIEESAVAAQKIQDILNKYNLSMDELDLNGRKDTETYKQWNIVLNDVNKRDINWHRVLLNAICDANYGKLLIRPNLRGDRGMPKTRVQIICKPGNYEVITYMYEMFSEKIKRMSGEYVVHNGISSKVTTHRIEYSYGAAIAIASRLRKSIQEYSVDPNVGALVCTKRKELQDTVSMMHPHLGNGTKSSINTNSNAFNEGYRNGTTVSINSGIEGMKKPAKQIS